MGAIFLHHQDNCYSHHHHHHGIEACEADILRRIPLLQYIKKPVLLLEELYERYPLGGQPGWFAFVYNERAFAYWDMSENRWRMMPAFLSAQDLLRLLSVDISKAKSGHVLMWSEEKGTFVLYGIWTVSVAPQTGAPDGIYLVPSLGIWTVDNGVPKKILEATTWDNIKDRPSVADFQADMSETDNKKISFVRNKSNVVVNNPVITVSQGGVVKGAFSLNQANAYQVELDAANLCEDLIAVLYPPDDVAIPSGSVVFVCKIIGKGYIPGTGFTSGGLVYFEHHFLNPFQSISSLSQTDTIKFRDVDTLQEFEVKHFGTSDEVLVKEWYFEHDIYMRCNTTNQTLYWK